MTSKIIRPYLGPAQMTESTLFYIHDPMCSWCWGFRPQWDALKNALPDEVAIVNIAGGLAKDCDDPMPQEMQETVQGWWRDIHQQLGTAFNYDFWSNNVPRRSTFMSCRAAIAAGYQNAEDKMINAIQQAYYLRALNPSNVELLERLAGELHLDTVKFKRDLHSDETQEEFSRQLSCARQLPIDGFPSLVLQIGDIIHPIERNYHNHEAMLIDIQAKLAMAKNS